ncbi:MAG: glycosyltransferase, exosortase A system-associated [Azoarcus sp.]|jgi:PEP-CTERM/exosortase A-associated glycosyltransferase|nr:glycosyltransferase, exosortase A system-associated [Azoarcus sp.]
MSAPLRILHIFDHSLPLHSGYTFRSANILRHQKQLGWQTFHLTSAKQGPCSADQEEVDGLLFHRTAAADGWVARLPVMRQRAVMKTTESRLYELARALTPDVLHAHSPVLNAWPALSVGRQLGIPVVYEIRAFWEDAAADLGTQVEGGPRYKLTRAMETRAVRAAHQVVTICEGLRSDLVARGFDARKITVVPNAVDVQRFQLRAPPVPELLQRLGLQGARVLGFIGSFYAYEGLDLMVAALPQVRQHMPEVKLLLVGGGPREPALKEQVRQLGLQSHVVFTGRVPHDEVDRYYDLVDLLVYPRHPIRLTELVTPLKPLEAMAQGHLLLASDVGGHRELIEDGVTGLLFKAGDRDELAARISAALTLPEGGATIRSAGRTFVESRRNWLGSVEQYRRCYGAALGRAL